MSIPDWLHPALRSWFKNTFGEPTDVQDRAWKCIAAGEHTLIAAPTGSGKTLAALLPCVDRIAKGKEAAERMGQAESRGVKTLYVTPLKALNNDIHHHMYRFAAEISAEAKEMGMEWPGFSIGVRTGDTTQSTRTSMLKRPPDLLVTTPESLYLMLTSLKSREILRTVEQVIVDEIHSLASDKRGVHLSLSLERLAGLAGSNPQRIGVSATQKPLERVACFLGGWEETSPPGDLSESQEAPEQRELAPRPVSVVESAMERRLQVLVTMPRPSVGAMDKEAVWAPLVERLLELMEGSRSILVFVNNRRLCERLTLRLNDYVGYELARSHHGSVSREKRLEVESLLKAGELRCLVATATLELGIDIGFVELVIQIDSPKQAAAGIQRIGRAGHAVGGASRGVIVARGRWDLPEAGVLARAIANRNIEDIRVPRWSLDVLAQHAVSAVAASDGEWTPRELYRMFARSDCYRQFPYERYMSMLDVLSGLYPFCRPLVGWDREADRLERLPVSSMAVSMNAGTIPQTSAFPVHHAETRKHLGELDEEYVYESKVGDSFQLGASSWTIKAIRQDRIYVTESVHAYSEIPFWKAEPGGRSPELGRAIGRLLAESREACLKEESAVVMKKRLVEEMFLDEEAAAEWMNYVSAQAKSCHVPTDDLIVAEHYKDDAARHHLVIHSLLGRRINRTWEMALRPRFDAVCSTPVYSFAMDDGIEFVFTEWEKSWFRELRRLTPEEAERSLWNGLPGTAMFGRAFRHIAETSLLLSRGYERQPSWKMRSRSEALLKEALPYSERFPFLRETYSVCLEEYLDLPGLFGLLGDILAGRMMLHETDSLAPSPFALRFANDYAMTALYESDALGRDVHMRLMNVNRSLAAQWFGEGGLSSLISKASLDSVKEGLESPEWLRNRENKADAAALLRILKEEGDKTAEEMTALCGPEALSILDELTAAGRTVRLFLGGEDRYIVADEKEWYARFPESADAVLFVVKRHIEQLVSFRAEDIAERYGMETPVARELLERWQEEGIVEQAPFAEPDEIGLLTASKVAERIVRASILDYRRQHGPIEPNRYAAHLLCAHHLHPLYSLSGEEGLLEAIRQLQGMFLPLSYWEGILFPSRIADYRKELLDRLCAAGEVLWLGRRDEGEKEGKIAFFAADSDMTAEPFIRKAREKGECAHPELLQLLENKGAAFLSALARETGELPSELFARLMDLVWEGKVSNDQFAPLRAPSQAKGKPGKNGGFQSGLGRWYAVVSQKETDEQEESAALSYCKHWIGQFGILTRSAAAMSSPYPWERLQNMLKRLEDWGMVTRGFFVRHVPSMQYSTQEQVELLQSAPSAPSGRTALVCAVDPANPFGAWLEWPDANGIQFARKPGNFLVYDGEAWLMWVEHFGRKIVAMPALEERLALQGQASLQPILHEVFKNMLERCRLRKIVVEQWNGMKCSDSPIAAFLLSMGGEKDGSRYVFWPSSLKGG